MKQDERSTEVEIILSSLDWVKEKESNPDSVKATGIIVDEILEWLTLAEEKNLGMLNVLRDVFVIAGTEADGNLKSDMFELFVTIQQIIESRKAS